jgi:hypothetical protein
MCTFSMLAEKWVRKSLGRCSLKPGLVAATMLAGVLLLPSSAAAQSPPNCNANVFNVTIAADTLATVAGDPVVFTLRAENPAVVGGQIGCDATSVDITFFCPAADGTPDLANPITVVTGQNYPAGTTSTVLGTFTCVMPDPASGLATARVTAAGDLQSLDPTPFTITRDLTVTIQSCLVKVDKQVSCDGGVTFVDQGLVFANEDGTISCNGVNGLQPAIRVRYQVQNVGETRLFQCVLDDTNNLFDLDADGVIITPEIVVGGGTGLIPAPGTPLCSDALDANEPNTASVNCFCTAGLDPDFKTSASDSARVRCQSEPDILLTKQCPDPRADGTNLITITATATTADLNFTSCTVTDTINLTDPTCPADVGVGTNVPVTPATFPLAAGASQVVTGVVGPLANDACNTATISCTVATTGQVKTDIDDTVCPAPGKGCLTRTPGFWGNHPAITSEFLNVEVCGVTIDNVLASNGTSAIEAICSVGRDGQILGPQLTQLVRQCTAAALNIAASVEGGGNCSTNFPNLANQMANCCSKQSVCTGVPNDNFTVNSCIEILDAFNNSIDTLDPFGPFVSPGPADSSVCRDSRNNGVVVTPAP